MRELVGFIENIAHNLKARLNQDDNLGRLTLLHLRILSFLSKKNGQSPEDLATALELNAAQVCKYLERLEADGLVFLEVEARNASTKVSLSKEGQRLSVKIWDIAAGAYIVM